MSAIDIIYSISSRFANFEMSTPVVRVKQRRRIEDGDQKRASDYPVAVIQSKCTEKL